MHLRTGDWNILDQNNNPMMLARYNALELVNMYWYGYVLRTGLYLFI